jgi:probable phosphoglycerate mutase
MMADRARRWLATTAAGPDLIVVSHGAFGRVLRGIYSGLDPGQTLAQEEPQDSIFRLSGGSIARIDT